MLHDGQGDPTPPPEVVKIIFLSPEPTVVILEEILLHKRGSNENMRCSEGGQPYGRNATLGSGGGPH